VRHALEEAEEAVTEVREGRRVAELNPQNAYIRRLQHILAQKYQLSSSSQGEGSQRRVVIFRGDDYPMSGDASVDVLGEEHDDPAFESGAGTE
jgi:hypothetical protein